VGDTKTRLVLSGSGNNQEALFQTQVATEVYIYIYGFKNNCTQWLTLIWLFSCVAGNDMMLCIFQEYILKQMVLI
jgi:hypothetical protein